MKTNRKIMLMALVAIITLSGQAFAATTWYVDAGATGDNDGSN